MKCQIVFSHDLGLTEDDLKCLVETWNSGKNFHGMASIEIPKSVTFGSVKQKFMNCMIIITLNLTSAVIYDEFGDQIKNGMKSLGREIVSIVCTDEHSSNESNKSDMNKRFLVKKAAILPNKEEEEEFGECHPNKRK